MAFRVAKSKSEDYFQVNYIQLTLIINTFTERKRKIRRQTEKMISAISIANPINRRGAKLENRIHYWIRLLKQFKLLFVGRSTPSLSINWIHPPSMRFWIENGCRQTEAERESTMSLIVKFLIDYRMPMDEMNWIDWNSKRAKIPLQRTNSRKRNETLRKVNRNPKATFEVDGKSCFVWMTEIPRDLNCFGHFEYTTFALWFK